MEILLSLFAEIYDFGGVEVHIKRRITRGVDRSSRSLKGAQVLKGSEYMRKYSRFGIVFHHCSDMLGNKLLSLFIESA